MSEPSAEAPPRASASHFDRLVSLLNAIGSLWIFGLMVLINSEIVGRTLFNAPIQGIPEMIELSIVGIVFLQLGDATRSGRLTRSTGCIALIHGRFPRVGRSLGAAFDLLGALFMALILYGSVPLLIESIERGHYAGNIGVFTAPIWPVKTIILIGCVVTLLQFVVFAWRHIGRGGDERPSWS